MCFCGVHCERLENVYKMCIFINAPFFGALYDFHEIHKNNLQKCKTHRAWLSMNQEVTVPSRAGHMPGLQTGPPAGGVQEGANL